MISCNGEPYTLKGVSTVLRGDYFICCLQSYACEIIYDDKIPEFHGTKIYDLRNIKIKSNKNNGALIYTYIKLFKMLQNLGNCAAIEYDRYGIEE